MAAAPPPPEQPAAPPPGGPGYGGGYGGLGRTPTMGAILPVPGNAEFAAWAIVEPILDDRTPVHEYDSGTWGPAEADRLTKPLGGWCDPE